LDGPVALTTAPPTGVPAALVMVPVIAAVGAVCADTCAMLEQIMAAIVK
jgi:hypothetical protein